MNIIYTVNYARVYHIIYIPMPDYYQIRLVSGLRNKMLKEKTGEKSKV